MADPTTADQALADGDFEAAIALMEREGAPAQDADDDSSHEDTDTGSDTPADDADAAAASKAAVAPAAKEAGARPAGDVKADGVLSKDGKHVIPYDVLESTRRAAAESQLRATQLEQQLQQSTSKTTELETQMATLRQKVEEAAAKAGSETDDAARAADPDNPLAGIDEDSLPPALVKFAKTMHSQLTVTQKKLESTQQELADVRKTGSQQKADDDGSAQMQAEIDANPSLVTWQSGNPAAWKRAVELDVAMHTKPEWQGKPVADRLAKVVRIVCAELDIEPAAATAGKKPGAGAKAEEAAVTSISDLPGGSPSHQSGADALQNASGRQTMAMFRGMSDEAIEATLRGLEK